MAFAFTVLRWPPEAFWRATPRELAAAMAGPSRMGEPMRPSDLRRLMEAFPDQHEDIR